MEGLFTSERGAPMVILGQPDMDRKRLDNPIARPESAQLHASPRLDGRGQRTRRIPAETRSRQHPAALLRVSHHGRARARCSSRSRRSAPCCSGAAGCSTARPMLWALMLAMPFPYIANTAGWMTAEIGRQPWLVYGVMRTSEGRLDERLGGQRPVHAARVHGHVHGAEHPVPVPRCPRDRTRPRDPLPVSRWFVEA